MEVVGRAGIEATVEFFKNTLFMFPATLVRAWPERKKQFQTPHRGLTSWLQHPPVCQLSNASSSREALAQQLPGTSKAWSLPERHLEPRGDDKTPGPICAPGGKVLIAHTVGAPLSLATFCFMVHSKQTQGWDLQGSGCRRISFRGSPHQPSDTKDLGALSKTNSRGFLRGGLARERAGRRWKKMGRWVEMAEQSCAS